MPPVFCPKIQAFMEFSTIRALISDDLAATDALILDRRARTSC